MIQRAATTDPLSKKRCILSAALLVWAHPFRVLMGTIGAIIVATASLYLIGPISEPRGRLVDLRSEVHSAQSAGAPYTSDVTAINASGLTMWRAHLLGRVTCLAVQAGTNRAAYGIERDTKLQSANGALVCFALHPQGILQKETSEVLSRHACLENKHCPYNRVGAQRYTQFRVSSCGFIAHTSLLVATFNDQHLSPSCTAVYDGNDVRIGSFWNFGSLYYGGTVRMGEHGGTDIIVSGCCNLPFKPGLYRRTVAVLRPDVHAVIGQPQPTDHGIVRYLVFDPFAASVIPENGDDIHVPIQSIATDSSKGVVSVFLADGRIYEFGAAGDIRYAEGDTLLRRFGNLTSPPVEEYIHGRLVPAEIRNCPSIR